MAQIIQFSEILKQAEIQKQNKAIAAAEKLVIQAATTLKNTIIENVDVAFDISDGIMYVAQAQVELLKERRYLDKLNKRQRYEKAY